MVTVWSPACRKQEWSSSWNLRILNEMISIKGQTPPLAQNLKMGRVLPGPEPDGRDPYPKNYNLYEPPEREIAYDRPEAIIPDRKAVYN